MVDQPAEDFAGYVARTSASLARTAYLLTGDRGLAEDLLQESLASVAQRWSAVAVDRASPHRSPHACAGRARAATASEGPVNTSSRRRQ